MRTRKRGALIVAALVAAAVPANTTIAAADIVGDWSAGADADLLEVHGVATPPGCGDEGIPILGDLIECTFELAQVVLGDSEAGVDTAGGLDNRAGQTDLVSFGHASNLDPDVLNAGGTVGAISAELLVESNAYQPGGDVTDSDQLGELPENPLLDLSLATTSATALDVSEGNTTCPEFVDGRATIAGGRNELVGLSVAPGAIDGFGLIDAQDENEVSYAESSIDLVDDLVGGTGDGAYGVESIATVELAPVDLLGGAIQLDVINPTLTVAHDGDERTVDYQTPIVTINGETVVDGETIEGLDALDLPSPLKVEVNIANTEDVEVTGDTATVSNVVQLTIVLADELEVATINVGNLSASANAPAGGVRIENCEDDDPLEVRKDVSALTVAPGGTFEYAVLVANRDECVMTDVVAVDRIEGPGRIVATDPEADEVTDTEATWNIGELQPNETLNFVITVQVDDDAQNGDSFDDFLDVTATCDGEEITDDDEINDIPRVDAPPGDGCSLEGSNKSESHEEVFIGETFSYYLHVFNTGDEACTDIAVTDTLTDEVTFVSCSDGCTNSGSTVTWELDELAPGSSRTLVITVSVNEGAEGTLPNVATLDPDNGDEVTVDTPGPNVTDDSVLNPIDPAMPPLDVDPGTKSPRTGGGLAALGALTLLGGAVLRRRNR